MLCERCHSNEANIVIQEVVNGVVREHNLCSSCAQEIELGQLFDDFPFGKLLSGILGLDPDNKQEQGDSFDQVVCPTCGTSYGEFVKKSQFGCADCYDTFGILMSPNIKKIQGSDTHVGKRPRYQKEGVSNPQVLNSVPDPDSYEEQLAILKSRLQEAIEEEEYQQAAKYRDQIRELQRKEGIDG